MVPMESLASPVASERETQPQTHAVSGQDTCSVMSDQCVEASPVHSDPGETPLISPPIQDTERPAPTSFSSPAGPQITLPGPETSVPQITSPQPCIEPQVQYQVAHQLQVSQALFAPNQVQIQSSVSQPPPQVQASAPQLQVQSSVSQPQSSVDTPVHSSPLPVSVLVPQQQPDPSAAGLSKGGDDSAVQQHTQNSQFQLKYDTRVNHSNHNHFSYLITAPHHHCNHC